MDDPVDDDWEDENGEDFNPESISEEEIRDVIPKHVEQTIDGDDEALSHSASRFLSIRDRTHLITQTPPSSGSSNGLSSTSDLLTRRGARRISPPFADAREYVGPGSSTDGVQYLRPITPTQPLMEDGDLNEPSLRTPTMMETFSSDGPLTPTNNAGPFVFDGSAGRVVGRTEVDISETDHAL